MNRINPLYIALFTVVLLFLILFKLHNAKLELKQIEHSYKENTKLAIQLNALKNTYSKEFFIPSSISNFFVQKRTKHTLSISSKKIDAKVLNLLMQKVLNGAYNITKLKINRINNREVNLYMEIKW